MPRMLDLECSRCGEEVDDFYVHTPPKRIVHLFRADGRSCHGRFEAVYRLRQRNAQWSDRSAVVVFRRPDGSISYPGRNDVPTPSGCERVVMRSLRAVEQFEKEHNVVSHIAHFDSGSGRSHDDTPPSKLVRAEHERFARFREYTKGIL